MSVTICSLSFKWSSSEYSIVFVSLLVFAMSSVRVAANGSPDLRGFGAGVAKLRSAEKSRKCADVSRSRPHLRMQSGDPMWRRMAPHRIAAKKRGAFRSDYLSTETQVDTENSSCGNYCPSHVFLGAVMGWFSVLLCHFAISLKSNLYN
jgi:hypothetical protein